MSPLDAAVSLKQIDSVTVHVPKHLNLYMSTGDTQRNNRTIIFLQGGRIGWLAVPDRVNEILPGILYKLLNQHDIIVEGFSGFSSRRLQLFQEVRV